MARYDFSIEEARKVVEEKFEFCDEAMIIVAKFPEINYVLVYRKSRYQPWVAAWAYNGINSWGQGHYFEKLEDAMEYILQLKGEN